MFPEQTLRMVNDIHRARRREADADRLVRYVLRSGTAVSRVSISSTPPAALRRIAASR